MGWKTNLSLLCRPKFTSFWARRKSWKSLEKSLVRLVMYKEFHKSHKIRISYMHYLRLHWNRWYFYLLHTWWHTIQTSTYYSFFILTRRFLVLERNITSRKSSADYNHLGRMVERWRRSFPGGSETSPSPPPMGLGRTCSRLRLQLVSIKSFSRGWYMDWWTDVGFRNLSLLCAVFTATSLMGGKALNMPLWMIEIYF